MLLSFFGVSCYGQQERSDTNASICISRQGDGAEARMRNLTPQQLRLRCARSPLEFGRQFLPHYFTCRPPKFHRTLCQQWQILVMKRKNPARETALAAILRAKGRRLVIAAPRGHGKSTVMSLQNVLHAALYGYKKYILLVSDTEAQAVAFLDAVKSELEDNEQLLEVFGPQKGRVWKSGSILLQNGCRIDAVGSGQKLRGRRNGPRRPDLILLDDIENDEEVRQRENREKLAAWFFGAVSKAGDRYTDIVFIGTALHYDSLLMRLLKNPAYRALRFQAVERFSDSHLWERWQALYTDLNDAERQVTAQRFFQQHKREMLQDTAVLWPAKLDYYDLMCIKVSEGEGAFWQELQNVPMDPETCLFPEEWMQFYDPGAVDFSCGFRFFGFCDPSLGKSDTGDYSALITLAEETATGILYVLEADLRRRSPDLLIEDILLCSRSLRERYGSGYTLFGIESNQFQWLLKEQLRKAGAKAGEYLPLCEVQASGSKEGRIRTLQPYVRNGYLRFSRRHILLLEQLRQFPLGRHDDGPDALQGAVELCARQGRLTTLNGLRL